MGKIVSLIYVPILHTQKEAGEIILSLQRSENKTPGGDSLVEEESIKEMWDGISKKIQEINLDYPSVRIYQDALPVCGRETEIVSKLAQKGSRNHQLILQLLSKDAKLEGTEDADLLIQEYDYLAQLLQRASISLQDYRATLKDYKEQSLPLMRQRDVFIANRIKTTLKNGQTPLVFMGVRHELEKLLERDFVISYIIYRLPFKKVGDIYGV